MLSTSRKDKNGVEIKEGDIVTINEGIDVYWQVKFGEYETPLSWRPPKEFKKIIGHHIGFYLWCKQKDYNGKQHSLLFSPDIEVVGNIRKNPELLIEGNKNIIFNNK